ncbi:protein of unknown function DUF995 [Mesorhizobium opportunistum WSM2075]|uniref:DUF995 domain-containing protein n=2 Tax=Mesorhizobium opportunistum TaxID=593909 RepID=F7Y616_MESOW|nr:protein of unknown function DUF995 [Mesorhizobium opportunistum WSM2075]
MWDDMRSLIVLTTSTGLPRPRTNRDRERSWSARLAPLLVICGQLAFSGAAHAANEKTSKPEEATVTVPTAFELQLLYADHTWIWKDGAAYFGKADRPLRAWTSGQDSASVAEGKWLVMNNGKMCMDLAWRSKSYKGKQQRTCYSHRIKGGSIEQRKDPDGEWYGFKRTPEDPSDEYRKFEVGDTKSAQFEETRKLIDSKN